MGAGTNFAMLIFYQNLNPILQALIAGCFAWALTALGAATVFLAKDIKGRFMDMMLGFAAGVMTAAIFFSLLSPSIQISKSLNVLVWIPPLVGFVAGGLFMLAFDKLLPHLHLGLSVDHAEGITTHWKRTILLVLAMTLHNFPEGLAIGVAFGALASGSSVATLLSAITLAIGIGIQDFPEGLAVSIPLRKAGLPRWKSFWYGQLTGIVEPLGAVVAAAAVMSITGLLPFALSFAAGCMLYIVVEELIPEAQLSENTDWATIGTLVGFSLMMVLEIVLG